MGIKRLSGIACIAMILVSVQAYSAPTITITAPQVTFSGNTALPGLDAELNKLFDPTSPAGLEFQESIDQIETQANEQLGKYGDQETLGKGFANANAYSAQSATMQGYQGYKLFALMTGFMIGGQTPSFDPNTLSSIPDTIADDPDIYAGIAPSVAYLNLGINAEKVFGLFSDDLGNMFKKFYFNVKFGALSYSYSDGSNSLEMKSANFGLGVNYQLIAPKNIGFGLLKWRGVSLGSGINYQSNSIEFNSKMDTITQAYTSAIPIAYGGYTAGSADVTATLAATPEVQLGIKMSTFSIPLEATTSVQMLWVLNMNVGAGIDLVFGKTDITATANSDFTVNDLAVDGAPSINYDTVPGTVTLDASTKGSKPSFARARLMAGMGLQAGPVKLDVPLYYYLASGLAIGMSVGIVW